MRAEKSVSGHATIPQARHCARTRSASIASNPCPMRTEEGRTAGSFISSRDGNSEASTTRGISLKLAKRVPTTVHTCPAPIDNCMTASHGDFRDHALRAHPADYFCPTVENWQNVLLLFRAQPNPHAPYSQVAVPPQHAHAFRGAAQRDRQRGRIATRLPCHAMKARHEVFRIAGERAPGRQQTITVADGAGSRVLEGAADKDRRMRLLRRLRPHHHLGELDELAVKFGGVLGPHLLHRGDLLAQARE